MLVDQSQKRTAHQALTPDEAKARVLDRWHQLDLLAFRRFPRDENLAHEGLLYVLQHLEARNWRRVRSWQRLGPFLPFLRTLAGRALTDFARTRFGHIRKPAWLVEKGDPLWDTAYRLLIVERWERCEVLAQLRLYHPEYQGCRLNEVVHCIRTRCGSMSPSALNAGQAELEQADDRLPEKVAMIQDKELTEALRGYLREPDDDLFTADLRVREVLERLRVVRLSDEDRLILRLRYRDGLAVPAIVRRLCLKGDPYKRLNKLVASLRKTCEQAGYIAQG